MKKIISITLSLAMVITMLAGCSEEEVYRVVKINHFEGEVTVLRDEKMNAFEGLQLISEDTVETGESSKAELLADSDKHILAEENTKFVLKATGTEKSGNITINLLYGTSLIEIENKLSEESYFEVTTPNATLSVRGTTFEVNYDEETETTSVEVIEGVVAVTTDEKTEELTNGQTAVITNDGIVTEEVKENEENKEDEEIKEEKLQVRRDVYKADGTISQYDTYEYDSYGNKIKINNYEADGTLSGYHILTYDSDGNELTDDIYNSDGTPRYYYSYEYDSDNNMIKLSAYKKDKTLYFYALSEYDGNGNRIKQENYRYDGLLTDYYEYEYDGDNNVIRYSYYHNEDGTFNLMSDSIYERNSKGKPTKVSVYNGEGILESYSVYDYDADDDMIKYTTYDKDGTLVNYITYGY